MNLITSIIFVFICFSIEKVKRGLRYFVMRNLNHIYRRAAAVVLTVVMAMMSASCSGSAAELSDTESPRFVDCEAEAGCGGGESDQYIRVRLKFDRKIKIDEKKLPGELRLVIGGERIPAESMEVSADSENGQSAVLHIPVSQVTNGVLEVSAADDSSAVSRITEESGRYGAFPFSAKKLIPSGVALETLQSSREGTAARVLSGPTHRSMIWVQLKSNGMPLAPDDPSAPDVMDSAIGVHEHDFLWATEETVASDIAEALNRFYGAHFTAVADGPEISVKAKAPSQGSVTLEIYEY